MVDLSLNFAFNFGWWVCFFFDLEAYFLFNFEVDVDADGSTTRFFNFCLDIFSKQSTFLNFAISIISSIFKFSIYMLPQKMVLINPMLFFCSALSKLKRQN